MTKCMGNLWWVRKIKGEISCTSLLLFVAFHNTLSDQQTCCCTVSPSHRPPGTWSYRTILSACLRTPFLLASFSGGQGFVKCNCITGCRHGKCTCQAKGLRCKSKCHGLTTCSNYLVNLKCTRPLNGHTRQNFYHVINVVKIFWILNNLFRTYHNDVWGYENCVKCIEGSRY